MTMFTEGPADLTPAEPVSITAPPAVIRSISLSQDEILRAIQKLHCPDGFECDVTFGKGNFWRTIPRPPRCFDLEPLRDGVEKADCRLLPLECGEIGNLVIDPPFLTYVRGKRTGNGNMVMSRQYSGFWTYQDLEDHYRDSISEAYRVLRPGGKLIFKCQDIIHNHRMHCTHVNVINMAEIEGFRLRDLFVLHATTRMPSPNRQGTQKHARIFHSYFLVFEATR